MIEKQPALLSIAKKVMSAEVINVLLKSPLFNQRGYKIADRWSLQQPEQIRQLASRSEMELLVKILDQQALEIETLVQDDVVKMLQKGISELDIFELKGIETQLII